MRAMRAAPLLAAAGAAALLGAPVAGIAKTPAPQKKNATYRGFTNQGSKCHLNGKDNQPCAVTAKVSKSGRAAKVTIPWHAPCSNSQVVTSETTFSALTITKGKIGGSGKYNEPLNGGAVSHDSVHVHGLFKRTAKKYTVAGTFSIAANVTLADGSTTQCQASVHWSAAH
jgi:hypothetical protein